MKEKATEGLSIGVAGVAGAMGTMVLQQIIETSGVAVAGGSLRLGSPFAETDVGEIAKTGKLGILPVCRAIDLFSDAEVVIDFTLPETIVDHSEAAVKTKTPWIIGTTGLSIQSEQQLEKAAKSVPIVYAPNMSMGVNLLFVLVKQMAHALDDAFDIEISEMHHRRKIDSPSGTALGLGQAAAAGRKIDFDAAAVLSREGETGARSRGKIGFAALRGGDVVGEHTVIFAGEGERVEISHKAAGRHIFAAGAIRAAKWIKGRSPGLYDMTDVLGLNA